MNHDLQRIASRLETGWQRRGEGGRGHESYIPFYSPTKGASVQEHSGAVIGEKGNRQGRFLKVLTEGKLELIRIVPHNLPLRGRIWKNQGPIPDFSRSNGAVTASISTPDTLLLGGVNAYRSTDGGTTFNLVNNWYEYYDDPLNKLHADVRGLDCLLYKGDETFFADTDGGSYISNDPWEPRLATLLNSA